MGFKVTSQNRAQVLVKMVTHCGLDETQAQAAMKHIDSRPDKETEVSGKDGLLIHSLPL